MLFSILVFQFKLTLSIVCLFAVNDSYSTGKDEAPVLTKTNCEKLVILFVPPTTTVPLTPETKLVAVAWKFQVVP